MQVPGTVSHLALLSLVQELNDHPVNRNAFFTAFRDRELTRPELQGFVRQYHYFCKHFVKVLEGLLYRTPLDEIDMRVELVKTLHSELGSGDAKHAHIALLDTFAGAAGLDQQTLSETVPIASVRTYLDTLQQLFLESDFLTALGAEMAVEVTAASEFRYLYPGLKRYGFLSEKDLVFFKLHLEEEVAHAGWLMEAVQRTAQSQQDFDRVAAGARATADAWHQFWLGLYEEIYSSSPTSNEQRTN